MYCCLLTRGGSGSAHLLQNVASSRIGVVNCAFARHWVNRHVDIAMATEGIGPSGESIVLEDNTQGTPSIAFAVQLFAFKFLDDSRENSFRLVDSLLLPLAYQ